MADDNKVDKKEAKRQAKLAKKEGKKGKNADGGDDDEEGGALSIFFVTVFIVLVWLAILGLLVKLDVGGFGSGGLTPVLKDVPVVNRVLPGYTLSGNAISLNEAGMANVGYDNLDTAVMRIRELEDELAAAQQALNESRQTIGDQQSEIARLRTFEDNQVEFEKIKDEFYNEVVFSDRAPDISQYRKYYEEIDPTNAQILYKQVIRQEQTDSQIEDYAKAYSSMKAKDAAAIFDNMRYDLRLVAKILKAMGTDAMGNILAAMDSEVAAQVTKIMEPTQTTDTSPSSVASSASSNNLR